MTETKKWELRIFNDEYNSFNWCIKCLMETMNYGFNQSEQIILIAHLRGSAAITQREFSNDLVKKKNDLKKRGLTITFFPK